MATSSESREARTSWMREMRTLYSSCGAEVGSSVAHPGRVVVKAMAAKGFEATFDRVCVALGFGSEHCWTDRLKMLRELQQEFDASQKPA